MSTPAGMLGRQTPWKPSQPAMTSHSSSCSAPSCVKRIAGTVGVEVVDADVADLEQERRARGEPCLRSRSFDDLCLAVDGDRPPPVSSLSGDAVALAVEAELDAVMDETLALQALADARLDEQVDRALLEHARADALLDVVAAAALEDDRLDALAVEQVREHQPCGPGPDDADLRAHQPPALVSSSRTRCAIANAPFAAGTPQ